MGGWMSGLVGRWVGETYLEVGLSGLEAQVADNEAVVALGLAPHETDGVHASSSSSSSSCCCCLSSSFCAAALGRRLATLLGRVEGA